MPLPVPNAEESKDEFIKRFMGDPAMVSEFPDEKQRYAVCESQWEGTDRYTSQATDGAWMLSSNTVKPTEQSQWIKVFPNGTYYISKYGKDVVFDKEFFNGIAKAFDSSVLSKPKIDKDHKFEMSYGDILGYEVKKDGMYFNIQLNSKGVELVKNKEYSYISPAWGKSIATDKTEFLNRLLAISLVNFPALEGNLPELQEQLSLSKFELVQEKPNGGQKMELYALAAEFDLNKDANVDSILSSVKSLKKELETSKTELKAKEIELKKAEDTAIQLSKDLKAVKDETLSKEAKGKVAEWIKLGKIVPAVQDIWEKRYVLNKEEAEKEMSLIPEQTYNGKQSQTSDGITLSAEQEKKMLSAKLDPKNREDVEAFLEAQQKGGK